MKIGFKMATLAVLSISFLYLLSGRIGSAGAVSGSEGPAHSVVKGDTLWDLTEKYLANPFFWPKVWQYNPQIKNPHLIYPGNQVRIPSPEELERMGAAERPQTAPAQTAPDKSMPAQSIPDQAAPAIEGPVAYVGGYLVERDLFESSGFILPSGEKAGEGVIVSTWEEKALLTDRNVVHLNLDSRDGVKYGDLFQVIHMGEDVVHPETRYKMGKQATVQGILKVTSVQEKLSTASIIKTYNPIMVGDIVRSYHPQPLIGPNNLSTEDKSIQGVIVQNTLSKSNLAVRDMVYLDVGAENSVTPGDRFVIYRSGPPPQVSVKDAAISGIQAQDFPMDIMGELVVLSTMKNTSTAVIVEELYEITPGDHVKYSPQSLPPIKKYDIN